MSQGAVVSQHPWTMLPTRQSESLSPPPSAVIVSTTLSEVVIADAVCAPVRCVHIQRSLGQLPGFRGYYLEQRRLQLTTDLTPPSRFLDSYQVYLSQVGSATGV